MKSYLKNFLMMIFFSCLLIGGYAGTGRIFYVSPHGNDNGDGSSFEQSWRTIQKGVDSINAGDTLILLPGEYQEQVVINKSGTKGNPITIKAARPGFSIIKGWKKQVGFEQVKGTRFAYAAKVSDPIYGVIEIETKSSFLQAPSLKEIDQFRGSFYLDNDRKTLYLHSSDGKSPDTHSTWISTMGGDAIVVRGEHVHIDGIVIAGFQPEDRLKINGYGIRLRGKEGVVRNSSFYFNAGAIKVEAEECVVENNFSYMNVNMTNNELAQIYCSGKACRNLKVLNNVVLSGQVHGIRFYSSATNGTSIGNIIKDTYIGLYYKTSPGVRVAKHNVVVESSFFNWHTGDFPGPMDEDLNTFQRPSFWQTKEQLFPGKNTLLFTEESDVNFVAPKHNDYRLQSDSSARGKGPDGSDLGAYVYDNRIVFISIEGNDSNHGRSISSAYRTIERALQEAKPGTVYYLLPGKYKIPDQIQLRGEKEAPIIFRSRDPENRATLLLESLNDRSVIDLKNSAYLEFETLNFEQGLNIEDSNNITIDHCIINKVPSHGIRIGNSNAVWVRRSTLWNIEKSPILIDKNSFDIQVTSTILQGYGSALIESKVDSNAMIFTEYNGYVTDEENSLLVLHNSNPITEIKTLEVLQKTLGGDRFSIVQFPDFLKKNDFYLDANSPFIGVGEYSGNIGDFKVALHHTKPAIEEVKVSQLTPNAVSISWVTPDTSTWGIRNPQQWHVDLPITSEIHYGKDPENLKIIQSFGDIFHHVSLHDLDPQTTYYYKVVIPEKVGYDGAGRKNNYAYDGYTPPNWMGNEGELQTFKTPSKREWRASSRIIYVSPEGLAESEGLTPESPTNLANASRLVQAGDTVLLEDGVYTTVFDPVSTGVEGAPITIRAVNRGKAILDGADYVRPSAIVFSWKDQMVIDGIVTRRFGGLSYGARAGYQDAQIYLPNCGEILIKNSLFIGYSPNYTKAVIPRSTERLIMNNNVFLGFPTAVTGRIEELAEFTQNTWYVPTIRALALSGPGSVVLKNNLIYGQHPQKTGTVGFVQSSVPAISDYNAFYFGPKERNGYLGYGLEKPKREEGRLEKIRKQLKLEIHSLELAKDEVTFSGPLPKDYFNDKSFRAFANEVTTNEEFVPSLEWFVPLGSDKLNNAGEGHMPIGARPVLEVKK